MSLSALEKTLVVLSPSTLSQPSSLDYSIMRRPSSRILPPFVWRISQKEPYLGHGAGPLPISSKVKPYHLDCFGTLPDHGITTIRHYVLVPIDNKPEDGLPSFFPRIIHETKLPRKRWMEMFDSCTMRLNSQEMVWFWSDVSNVMVGLTTVPPRNLPIEHISGLVWKSFGYHAYPVFSADPCSGRVCILTLEDTNQIMIMDYLLPPSDERRM